jgi:steroid delta-isomerase-like uncharacterized protein
MKSIKFYLGFAALAAMALVGCSDDKMPTNTDTSLSEQNEALMRRFFEEGLNTGNLARISEMLASDFTLHNAPPNLPPGAEGLKALLGVFRSGFPDYKDTIEDVVLEGDKVVVRWTFRGTHQGEFFGVPATNKLAITHGISIFRITDGKIKDDWTEIDMLGLLQQLSATP